MKKNLTGFMQSQRGLTLVEVLVAVAILAIGILAVAAMQKTAISVNMRAFDITKAANLAQSQLELLQSLSVNHANLTGSHSVENLEPGYDCDWVVTAGFPSGLTAPPARGRLIQLAVTANGDTTPCGDDGTCNSGICNGADGTGSSVECYAVVGMKVAPNW